MQLSPFVSYPNIYLLFLCPDLLLFLYWYVRFAQNIHVYKNHYFPKSPIQAAIICSCYILYDVKLFVILRRLEFNDYVVWWTR